MKDLCSQISSSDKSINNQALISLWIAGFKGAVLSNSHRNLFSWEMTPRVAQSSADVQTRHIILLSLKECAPFTA